MPLTPAALIAAVRTPEGRKVFRYVVVSMISFIIGVTVLGICKGLFRWSAFTSNLVAAAIATGPAYVLTRRWAWGKSGKSHIWREVVPFWVLAFVGWGFSTVSVAIMQSYANHHHFSHISKTFWVDVVFIGAFGVLWIGKFIIFNKVMFVHHHQHDGSQARQTA